MTKISLFFIHFLSFIPLWVSIIFIDVMSIIDEDKCLITEYTSIAIIIVLLLFSLIIAKCSLKDESLKRKQRYSIASIKENKTISVEYLLSYILPLFAFDFTVWRQIVLFIIFFSTISYLCIKHNYLSANIVLELLGYRFYECCLQNEDNIQIEKLVITKKNLIEVKNETLIFKVINNDILLLSKK